LKINGLHKAHPDIRREPDNPNVNCHAFDGSSCRLGCAMEALTLLREISGMSQFAVARKSGIPRVRLSLAETGQLLLCAEERERVRKVLICSIEERAAQLQDVLAKWGAEGGTEVTR